MKKYIVTVCEMRPVWVDYVVEAESKADAKENYDGFPIVNEEIGVGEENVVEVRELEND